MNAMKRAVRWGLDQAGYTIARKAPGTAPAEEAPLPLGESFLLYGKAMALERRTLDPRRLLTFDAGRQPEVRDAFLAFNDVYQVLARSPFLSTTDHHVNQEEHYHAVLQSFRASGLTLEEWACDAAAFRRFLAEALPTYERSPYAAGYGGVGGYLPQKAFEHWVSAAYLAWAPEAVVIDLACDLSPATEVLRYHRRARFYRHDIQLPTDLPNGTISGFADAIECPDAFADCIMAHCAIDNFEGSADTDVFREAARILKPGGRILITPLHMATVFENRVALGAPGVQIDEGAVIALGPPASLRFGRHYSVEALRRRVIEPNPGLRFHVVHVTGLPLDAHPSTATNRFMLIATRTGG